jgi:ribosomal protein S18 acetylase RimI-like enzyme
MSDITLRAGKATHEDADSVVALGRAVFSATFAHTVRPEALDAYLAEHYNADAILADLRSQQRRCLLAEDAAGELLGYAFLATDSTQGEECLQEQGYTNVGAIELQRIYTHPHSHGTGLAHRIADAAFALAQGEGFRHIWLGVLPENARAVGFYTKLGFLKVGTHEFRLGDHIDIDDIMIREL